MDLRTAGHFALLLGAGAAVAAHAALSARLALRWDWKAGLAALQASIRRWSAALLARGAPKGGPDDDLEGRAVAQEVDDRLVQTMRRFADLCGLIMAGFVTVHIVSEALGRPKGTTGIQDLAMVLLTLILALMRLFPQVVNARTLDAWYCAVMLCMCLAVASASAGGTLLVLQIQALLALPRLALTLAFRRVPATALCNAAYSLVQSYAYFRTKPLHSDYAYIAFEALTFGFVTFTAAGARSSLVSEVRQRVQASILSKESSAMAGLLGLVCDAVVELDANLRMVAHDPKLAAMLMLNEHKCTKGLPLQHYMPSDGDRLRFEATLHPSGDLESGPAPTCPPVAVHSTLHDSMDNQLKVEMLVVPSEGLDGGARYLVGIREFTDQQPAERKSPRAAAAGLAGAGRSGGRGAATRTLGRSLTEPRGHPAQGPKQRFGTAAGGGSESSTSERSPGGPSATTAETGRRVLPLRPTTSRSKRTTLMEAMLSWSVAVPAATCCRFHAALLELRKCSRELERHRCQPDFRPTGDAQCQACGIMCKWRGDLDCDMCNCPAVQQL